MCPIHHNKPFFSSVDIMGISSGRFWVLLCLWLAEVKLDGQEWGTSGDHEALPTASTVAAQHALAESRQRRDERSLDKGARMLRDRSCV